MMVLVSKPVPKFFRSTTGLKIESQIIGAGTLYGIYARIIHTEYRLATIGSKQRRISKVV